MDDAVWKRGPMRKIRRSIPTGQAAGAEAFELVRPLPAFIVCRRLDVMGLPDYLCRLITEDGLVLFEHICSSPHYAYSDLWARRPSRQHDHPNLSVDPHTYSVDEFRERHPLTARAAGYL